MQIKVQGTKPNTSLERKTKNLCSHIEMQLDYIRLVMRKLIQQITTIDLQIRKIIPAGYF